MKYLSKMLIAVILAMITAALLPAQVFASAAVEYISEVKVFYGNPSKAEAEDYKVLTETDDEGKSVPADLNRKAGGGWGSQGETAVYLGYKTTRDRKDAVTDLALMNMKGGYSVEDYELLMESQMKSQIIPFVDNFLATINEYRENYNSDYVANKERAQYVHDMLNKLTDDDCEGAGLGDLLLNQTKYEMGDEAYNKLSESEKKKHADILTIIAQSNGKATLLMETLLVRAADINEDTWLDRFEGVTYDDLVDYTGLTPTDAAKKLSKLYDDDANRILDKWEDFRDIILNYDADVETVESFDEDETERITEAFNDLDDNSSEEEKEETVKAYNDCQVNLAKVAKALRHVIICEYLKETDYEDGTLYDFFSQTSAEVSDDITLLYPMVAAFSEGQKAGLEYISLEELFSLALTDIDNMDNESFDYLEKTSVYEGVDRGIYEKGGVALTSDALRKDAESLAAEDRSKLSGLSIAMIVLTGAAFAGFLASAATFMATNFRYNQLFDLAHNYMCGSGNIQSLYKFSGFQTYMSREGSTVLGFVDEYQTIASARNAVVSKLALGFSIATVIIGIITVIITWRNMKAYYKVDFTPIPKYMIDEKDLIGYNSKGEKIVLKNQAAYYKAAESSAKNGDFKYDEIGSLADMNGCTGQQWLALYVNKNELMEPIIASSLIAVVGSAEIPSGYRTGIHMFGTDAASNLNNPLYDWNQKAPGIYVYFKTDSSAANTTATTFTGGTLALTGGAGLAIGAVASAFAMKVKKKKAEEK